MFKSDAKNAVLKSPSVRITAQFVINALCKWIVKYKVNIDHCPWMGVCIGHTNRRYFVKFLTYLPAACFTVVALVITLDMPSILII